MPDRDRQRGANLLPALAIVRDLVLVPGGEIDPPTRFVAMVMADKMGDAEGECFALVETVAGLTGLCDKTVRRAQAELVAVGIFERRRNRHGRYSYTIATQAGTAFHSVRVERGSTPGWNGAPARLEGRSNPLKEERSLQRSPERHPPLSPPRTGGCVSFERAVDYAATCDKPAGSRQAQRTIRRWIAGRLPWAEIAERIERGDHYPVLPR